MVCTERLMLRSDSFSSPSTTAEPSIISNSCSILRPISSKCSFASALNSAISSSSRSTSAPRLELSAVSPKETGEEMILFCAVCETPLIISHAVWVRVVSSASSAKLPLRIAVQ